MAFTLIFFMQFPDTTLDFCSDFSVIVLNAL